MSLAKPFMGLALVVSIVTTAFACSPVDGGGDGGGAASTVDPAAAKQTAVVFCEGYRSRDDQCDETEAQAKYDTCVGKSGACMGAIAVPAAVEVFKSCMEATTCTPTPQGCDCERTDDRCFFEAAKSVAASPKRDAYESACRRKLEACGKGQESFSDDWCTTGDNPWQLFVDAAYDVTTPCFERPCGEVNDCLLAEIRKLAPACGGDD